MDPLRLGAYILPGDPTWLRSSLARYYDHLDTLVVPVPDDGRSWTGRPIPVQQCLTIIRELDTRGIVRTITGRWNHPQDPMVAENQQRQAAIDAIQGVDWVLQIDNDELLPDLSALIHVLDVAAASGAPAVEWPMRVIFRELRNGRYLEVVAADGGPRYDYPGPIAVRPDTRLSECRRSEGSWLRPVVRGDDRSLQVVRRPAALEQRETCLDVDQAILHNSWGRSAASIWRKVRSTAHQEGWRMIWYFGAVWWASPLTWRWLRNFHLFSRSLWPRLRVLDESSTWLVDTRDRRR